MAFVAFEIEAISGKKFALIREIAAGLICHNALGAVLYLCVCVSPDVNPSRSKNGFLCRARAVRIAFLRNVSGLIIRLSEKVFTVASLRVGVVALAACHKLHGACAFCLDVGAGHFVILLACEKR